MIRRTLPCFTLLALAALPGSACLRADCVKNDPFCGPAWLAYAGPAGPVCVAGLPSGRVSISSSGAEGNGPSLLTTSGGGAMSSDGRFVTFSSTATTLAAGDTNGAEDVFVHDRQSGETVRVSVGPGGAQGGANSLQPRISADGRYVVFESSANELASPNLNGLSDIYIVERLSGMVTRASDAPGGVESTGGLLGTQAPDLSADGRYVAFFSEATNLIAGDLNASDDIFVYDRIAAQTTRASVATGGGEADDFSETPRISRDGRYIVFTSDATNLVAGDANLLADVFVHDRLSGETTRVSVATGGGEAIGGGSDSGAISADGRYVAFLSEATNLVAGDTNAVRDAFVHDRQTRETTRVSVATGGAEGNGLTQRVQISADGRYVAFSSGAANLVAGDTNTVPDVFLHDRQRAETTRLSLSLDGQQLNAATQALDINSACGYVTLQSNASNFVSGDTNGQTDVFVLSFP